MKRSRVLLGVAAPAAALVLALTGCQQAAEQAAEQAVEQAIEDGGSGVSDVEIDDNGITVEGEDGSFSAGQGDELPEGWPSEVALPDGATITSSMGVDQGGEQGWSVVANFDDSPNAVVDAFKASLTGAGFTEDSAYTSADMTLLAYSSDTYTVAVTVGPEGDATTTSVTVSSK